MDQPIQISPPPDEATSEPAVITKPAAVESAATSFKQPYPPPAALPTQIGPEGIRFDFNQGCRVLLPGRTEGKWRVRLRDVDTGNILFESENKGAMVTSSKRWFVRFRIEVWSIDDAKPGDAKPGDAKPGDAKPDDAKPGEPRTVLLHEFDTADRDILVQLPIGTLGDILAWFPYVNRFATRHPGARVTCAMSGLIIPLLQNAYPQLRLVTHEELVEQKLSDVVYATYSIGLFFDDAACDWQPTDFRHVGLHRTAGYILGVSPDEEAPRLAIEDDTSPIDEPYACIAVQSSSGCKMWSNPHGWREVVAFLKSNGYRVVCIDQKAVHGQGLMWTHIPHGVEDQTGDRPLVERARWLSHAALFVGLSSGLSWLAWAAGIPVVLISGFTHPTNEFATPYRVINWHACNSCWNDVRVRFDHKDFLWCPRHQNTPRQFECTRLITPAQVTQVIQRIPGFGVHS